MKTIWFTALIGVTVCLTAGCDRGNVKISSPPKQAAAEPPAAAEQTPPPDSPPAAATNVPAPAVTETSTNAEAPKPMTPAPAENQEVAVIKTTVGEMVAEFWPDVAPETVENFKKLIRQGFYDGTCFHRIIKGFMIQGGDPLTKDPAREAEWGTGGPGYNIKAEFNDRKHIRGVLSMARSQHPDSAGSQFFVCLDPAPSLDGQYTGFGKVIKGEDVLMKIGDTPCVVRGEPSPSKPTVRIGVESIKLVPRSSIN